MPTISFPKLFSRKNQIVTTSLSYNIKSINESLTSLLMTRPGELLGDPNYGTQIYEQLFNVQSTVNVNLLKDIIVKDINTYLPNIRTNNNLVKIYNNERNGTYKITIAYYINNDEELQNFEIVVLNAL